MFNRTYHIRAAKQAIIAEIAKGYYRPASRPDLKRNGPKKPENASQLEFDFDEQHCPLADLFPDAYE